MLCRRQRRWPNRCWRRRWPRPSCCPPSRRWCALCRGTLPLGPRMTARLLPLLRQPQRLRRTLPSAACCVHCCTRGLLEAPGAPPPNPCGTFAAGYCRKPLSSDPPNRSTQCLRSRLHPRAVGGVSSGGMHASWAVLSCQAPQSDGSSVDTTSCMHASACTAAVISTVQARECAGRWPMRRMPAATPRGASPHRSSRSWRP